MSEYDPTTESTFVLQSKLAQHVLLKGWQAGSLIGVVAVAPVQALLARSFSLSKASRSAGIASVVGVGLTGIMLAIKCQSIDRDGYEDRIYRLHYNQGQIRTDQFAGVGSLIGLAAGVAAARRGMIPMSLLHVLGGAAAGSTAGLFLHGATSPSFQKHPKATYLIIKEETKLGR